jgi:hypothetical protein
MPELCDMTTSNSKKENNLVCGVFGSCRSSVGDVKPKIKFFDQSKNKFESIYTRVTILPEQIQGEEPYSSYDLIRHPQLIRHAIVMQTIRK